MPLSGYYSLVQWCPDAGRRETVNVGLALVGPTRVRPLLKTEASAERLRAVFGGPVDTAFLHHALRAFEGRFHRELRDATSAESVDAWAARLGNEVVMTPCRGVAIEEDRPAQFEEMFDRLVRLAERPSVAARSQLGRRLNGLWRRRSVAPWAMRDREIAVPTVRTITAPYAYRNGVLNLVKPINLGERAEDDARLWRLAVDLLKDSSSAEGKTAKVEVLLATAHDAEEAARRRECEAMFAGSGVRLFTEERFEEYAEHVLKAVQH